MSIRSATLRGFSISATILALAAPFVYAGQRTSFADGLLEFTDAAEGIYGDEGPRLSAALDAMSRALADTASPPSPTVVQDALGAMPFIPLAAYREGYERLARGEFGAALASWRGAVARDPLLADPAARAEAARGAVASLKQGRLLAAQSLPERAPALRTSPEARRIAGLAYWAASEYDRSIEQLETAIRLNGADERARLALSRVLSSANRDADAARVLEETTRVIFGSGRARWWLAMSYERLNRFADARSEFERAADAAIAGRGHFYATIGRLASGAADLDGAVDALRHAVNAEPRNPAWHKLLAGALMHQDRADDALAEFVQALLLDSADAETNLGIGQIHLAAGRYLEAVNALRRAAELNVNAVDVQYALATALTRLGNPKEAARYFERVEQAQKQGLANRRRTLSIDTLKEEAALKSGAGDHQGAVGLWRQAVEIDPQGASTHVGLAAALSTADQHDLALLEYERAAALGADATVYRTLAELYAKAGRAPDAARARLRYEAALQGAGAVP